DTGEDGAGGRPPHDVAPAGHRARPRRWRPARRVRRPAARRRVPVRDGTVEPPPGTALLTGVVFRPRPFRIRRSGREAITMSGRHRRAGWTPARRALRS